MAFRKLQHVKSVFLFAVRYSNVEVLWSLKVSTASYIWCTNGACMTMAWHDKLISAPAVWFRLHCYAQVAASGWCRWNNVLDSVTIVKFVIQFASCKINTSFTCHWHDTLLCQFLGHNSCSSVVDLHRSIASVSQQSSKTITVTVHCPMPLVGLSRHILTVSQRDRCVTVSVTAGITHYLHTDTFYTTVLSDWQFNSICCPINL